MRGGIWQCVCANVRCLLNDNNNGTDDVNNDNIVNTDDVPIVSTGIDGDTVGQ